MNKTQYIPIAVAVVAILVIASITVYNLSDDNSDERYYFYISTDDSVGGWHSAEGKDAADAFANAMKSANLEYEINSWGYLSKIGDNEGYWYSAMYLYGNTSKLAAESSVKYPVIVKDEETGKESYASSNGWITIVGYDDAERSGDKIWQMNGNIFFFSMYDSVTWAHSDPTSDTKWMNSGPFASSRNLVAENETYHFYIDCGNITGWYSAEGKDAADAFAKAMNSANLDYGFGSRGYLSKIGDYEGSWYSAMYLYGNASKLAAEASVLHPVKSYGSYNSSNGWINVAGYNDADRGGDKIWQMNGNIFFFSMYDSATYAHSDPTTTFDNWSTTGPFATA